MWVITSSGLPSLPSRTPMVSTIAVLAERVTILRTKTFGGNGLQLLILGQIWTFLTEPCRFPSIISTRQRLISWFRRLFRGCSGPVCLILTQQRSQTEDGKLPLLIVTTANSFATLFP